MHGIACLVRTGPAGVGRVHPYRIGLPAGPAAAVAARRHVWALIHTWDVPIDAYAAALLTSELVTEVHSRDENAAVQLMISWVDGEFRVEVRELPGAVRPPGAARAGLALVVAARRNLHWPRWRGPGGREQ